MGSATRSDRAPLHRMDDLQGAARPSEAPRAPGHSAHDCASCADGCGDFPLADRAPHAGRALSSPCVRRAALGNRADNREAAGNRRRARARRFGIDAGAGRVA